MGRFMTFFIRIWLLLGMVAGAGSITACEASKTGLNLGSGGTDETTSAPGGRVGTTSTKSSGGASGTPVTGGASSDISSAGRTGMSGIGGSINGSAGRSGTGGIGGSISGSAGRSGTGGIGGSISGSAGRTDTGGTGGSGGTTSGVCAEAPCLASLFLSCQPSGSCTKQSTTTTTSDVWTIENVCYSNGVKTQASFTIGATIQGTSIAKRNNTVCYRIDVSGSISGSNVSVSYVFRDAGENQVATATYDGATMSATCNGGNTAVLSDACLNTTGSSDSCTSGVCTF